MTAAHRVLGNGKDKISTEARQHPRWEAENRFFKLFRKGNAGTSGISDPRKKTKFSFLTGAVGGLKKRGVRPPGEDG